MSRNTRKIRESSLRPDGLRPPSVVRQSIWAVSAQIATVVVGIPTSVLLNRSLGPEGRAVVGVAMLWPPLLGALVSAGWTPALAACSSRTPELSRGYVSAALLANIALAGAACALGFVLVPVVMPDAPDLWPLTRWMLLGIPLTLVSGVAIAGLEARRRFDFTSRIYVGNLVGLLAPMTLLALRSELDPHTYCASVLAVSALTTSYALWLFVRVSDGSWKPRMGPLPGTIGRIAPLAWAQQIQTRVDQIVIVLLAPSDPAAYGLYLVGTKLASLVLPVAHGLSMVLLPESARRSEGDSIRLFVQMGRLFLLAAAVVSAPLIVAAPWVLWIFYGEAFRGAAYAVQLGLLATVLSGLYTMGLSTLQGSGRSGTASVIGISSAIASTLGSVCLLPWLGYSGALIGQALGTAGGLYFMRRLFRDQGLTLAALVPGPADLAPLWRRLGMRKSAGET